MPKSPILLLALGLFFLAACKKSDLPDGENQPVFMVTYGADPETTVTAGKDDVYLFTRYATESGGYRSVSTFSKVDCPAGNCPGSLTFEFFGALPVDTVLSIGFYKYALADSVLQGLDVYQTRYFWNNDPYDSMMLHLLSPLTGTYGTSGTSVEILQFDIPQWVSIDGTNHNDLASASTRRILPSNPEAFPIVDVLATRETNVLTLKALTAGSAAMKYLWNTGDTTSVLNDSIVASDQYVVTVTDNFGQTASAGFSILPTQNAFEAVSAGFGVQSTLVSDSIQFGVITIQWVDGQGGIWRSDAGLQPLESRFAVLKSEPYDNNEKGDHTWKLRVSFDCLLFNQNGNSRSFLGEGIIALAHP